MCIIVFFSCHLSSHLSLSCLSLSLSLSSCQSFSLSSCLSLSLSHACLSLHMSVVPSIHMSVSLHFYLYLFSFLSLLCSSLFLLSSLHNALFSVSLSFSRRKEEVILEAQRDKHNVHLLLWWHLSSPKCGVRTEVPKVQRRVVLRGDIVKDDSGAYAKFTEQGLVIVPNDGRRGNGCYCSTTRLWRKSSWRNIGVYPGKNGGCYSKFQSQNVRCMDTSSTT